MTIRSVHLERFRNYRELDARFDERVNVICGDNAQGKTNLLEALAYLSTAASHRARYDRELIEFGQDDARMRAAVHSRGREYTVECTLRRGRRRELVRNGVRLKNASELSEILGTVLFCPEDLDLIRAGAAERRRFLDACICQLRPRYAQALREYKRLYEHKTRILRDWGERPDLLDPLDDFSGRMAQCGAVLIHYRAHFVKRLCACAPGLHAACTGGREELGLRYETVSAVLDPQAPPREILPLLLQRQRELREAEIRSRQCLTGPHRDDLLVELDGNSARAYASQGQARTAALCLKLASRDVFQQETGSWPVLLLDDVLSELDAHRQEFVLNQIRGGQVFITCCDEHQSLALRSGARFHIRAGELLCT